MAVDVLNPAPGAAASVTSNVVISVVKATVAAASRLLDQATFGPTLTDIQHVQAIGLDAYLTEQFGTAATVLPDIATPRRRIARPRRGLVRSRNGGRER